MKKRLLSIFLALCMALTWIPVNVWAVDDTATDEDTSIPEIIVNEPDADELDTTPANTSGELPSENLDFPEDAGEPDLLAMCGNDLSWSLENGILSISGTGPMFDYAWHISEDLDEYLDTPWFDWRDEITEIIINEGVTSIGANAFSACWNVTSISIPDSVTDIGENAFDGCPTFGEAVPANDIGIMPYASATGNVRYAVLVLDVSGSMSAKAMTAQKTAAIKFCTALLSADGDNHVAVVSFSSGVHTVSDFSQDIDALTAAINKISASGNTYTIGALQKADELLSAIPESAGRSIVLCSDGLPNQGATSTSGPWNSADSSSYYRYANAVNNKAIELMQKYDIFTLGFFHSLSGKTLEFAREFMEAIQDAGYYEVTNPDDLEFTFGDIAGDVTTPGHSGIIFVNVPKDKYVIHVVNDEGKNLSGVTVTCNGTLGQTNNNGLVTFDKSLFVSTPKITATANGYIDWSNEHSNWSFDSRGYATIKMYPTSASKYKLSECIYSNVPGNVSPGINLLTWTKTVSLGNDLPMAGDLDFGKFYLSCKAIDDSEITQYELWQNTTQIAVSTDGKFSLQFDKTGAPFVEGGKCFVRVRTATGEQVDTNINLQFKKNDINKNTEISFNGGGHSGENSKISFKVGDNVPFIGGSTFTLDLPVSSHATFLLSPDGKKIQIGLNFADLKNDNEHKTTQEQFDAAKKLLSDARTAANLKAGKLDNKQKRTFYSLLKGNSKKWTFFKDGEWNFLGYVEGDLNNSTLKGHVMLQYSVTAAEFGFTTWVVVVPVTVQVGLDLEGNLIGEIGYDWANAQFVGSLDFDASAKLKAFGGVGVGKAIGAGAYGSAKLEGEFRIIGTPWGLRSIDLTGELGVKAYFAWLTYERPFAKNTWHLYTGNNVRSFSLDQESEPVVLSLYEAGSYEVDNLGYLSEESEWMGTPIMLLDAPTATQLKSLQMSTYRNTQPVMVSANNALYAVLLKAEQDSGNVYAAVTKFDGSTWSEPVRVDNSAVMDGTPSLCVDNSGNIWLAYAQTSGAVTFNNTESSLLAYAKGQKIVVGSINPQTLAFTPSATYSGEGYAHLQQLALVNGTPTLVWADSTVNNANDVFWPTTSVLYTATYANGSWGAKQPAASVNKPVLQVVAGASGVAYVADEDGLYTTTEDQHLYLTTGTTLATNVQGKVTYGTLPGGTAAGFIWNAEDYLKTTASGMEIPAVGITDEYAVAGNRIYYSSAGEEGAQLTTIIYNSGSWSNPITLTDNKGYLENISVVRLNNTDYVMGMNTSATITGNDVIDSKDLVWGQIMSTSDLRLDGIDYDADGLVAGVPVPVTLTVTNAGDHAVSSIDVFVNNSSQGTQSYNIAPGESTEVTVNVTCPSELREYTFRVAESGQSDFTPDDNAGTVGIGYADLEVTAEEERIEDSSSMVVYVMNKGVALATGSVTVTDNSGNVVTNRSFAEIGPGDMFVLSIPMSTSGIYTATATLANGEDDLYTYNNSDTVAIGVDAVTDPDPDKPSIPDTPDTPSYPSGSGGYYGGSSSSDSSSSNPSYRITVSATSNGIVTVTPTSAKSGAKVTITATPNDGYTIGGVTVTNSKGKSISVTDNSDGTYTFTMPASQVTVSVTFVAIGAPSSSPNVSLPFTDVFPSDWFYSYVQYVYANGLMTGDGSTTIFNPNGTMTRAMVWTVLGRMAGADVNGTGNEWYAKAQAWAVTNNVSDGTNPNNSISRQELMTMLWRYIGSSAATANLSQFSDHDSVAVWADGAMQWAVSSGFLVGDNGRLNPAGDARRCEVATIFMRFCENIIE